MKKIIITSISVAIGFFFMSLVLDHYRNDTNNINKELQSVANEMSSTLPQMLDSETRLDAVAGGLGKFIYKNTLINYSADQVDAADLRSKVENNIRNGVCTTPSMEAFRQKKVIVEYTYYGKNGAHIMTLTIPTSEC